jgi:Arabinose efflux permease
MERPNKNLTKVAFAGVVGTTIEWYDFFVAGVAAATIWPSIFFPSNNPSTAVLISISSFALGFATRPIGALIFGHYGDRVGRKNMLIWTLILMGGGTLGLGLVPPYSSIGVYAGILITLLRLIQGLGVGGEWGGVSVWLAEHSHSSRWRAFWTSWVNQGVPLGLLMSSGLFTLFQVMFPRDFSTVGWRILFYIGGAVIIIGIFIRLRLEESPLFKSNKQIEKFPFSSLIKNKPKTLALMIGVFLFVNGVGYIVITFSQAYLKALGVSPVISTLSQLIASSIAVFVLIGGALLGDKIGRKKVLIVASVILVIFTYPYFIMLNTGNTLLIILAQAILWSLDMFGYSVIAAFFSEQFPTKFRYSGSGFSFHVSAALSGGLLPVIGSYLLLIFGGPSSAWPYIGGVVILYCLTSLISVVLARETIMEELSNIH